MRSVAVHLRSASIWYDEAITLLTTSGHGRIDWPLGLRQFEPTANVGKILSDLYQQDVHPPLYFWALALWRVVFGASLEVARSFSALCVAPVLAVEYAKRRRTDRGWMVWTWLSFGLGSAPLIWLLRVHMVARPDQYPGFGFLPHEVWALLKGSMQDVLPNTSLPGWGLAVIVGAFLVGAGLRSAIKRQKWSVPIFYGAYLCSFLLWLCSLTSPS